MEIALIRHLPRKIVAVLAVVGGSLLLAFCAQCAFPLPFSPVPVTLQTLGLAILAYTLGSKKAFLAVAAYLVEGACGLPFFAKGMSGVPYMLGATGGYLLGFLLSAFIMGYLFERGTKNSLVATLSTLVLGDLIILGLGTLWLSAYIGANALAIGFYPFVIGSMAKIALMSGMTRVWSNR